jgi:hypothetical protein
MIDHYIDLKSYDHPQKEFMMTHAQMLTTNLFKRNFFKFDLADINTDSGLLLENE